MSGGKGGATPVPRWVGELAGERGARVMARGGMQEGTEERLGRVWRGILGLYGTRPDTGSAGAELVGLAFAAEDLLVQRKRALALTVLSRAEELLEDLGAGVVIPSARDATNGGHGRGDGRGLPETQGGGG